MDSTLHALGGLLLKAIPTILLLIVLHVYLKWMFFAPLNKVLAQRRELTEGARESAEALFQKAADKTAEYEGKLREAREQIYREQEETRRQWIEAQTKRIDQARERAHDLIRQAREQIEADKEAAKRELGAQSETLAGTISESLLKRRSA